MYVESLVAVCGWCDRPDLGREIADEAVREAAADWSEMMIGAVGGLDSWWSKLAALSEEADRVRGFASCSEAELSLSHLPRSALIIE
jgi:hypothetical protein